MISRIIEEKGVREFVGAAKLLKSEGFDSAPVIFPNNDVKYEGDLAQRPSFYSRPVPESVTH